MGQICGTASAPSCTMVPGSRHRAHAFCSKCPSARVAACPSLSGAAAFTFQRGREADNENLWEQPKQQRFGCGLVTVWTGHSGVIHVPSGHKSAVFPGDSQPATSGRQAPQLSGQEPEMEEDQVHRDRRQH